MARAGGPTRRAFVAALPALGVLAARPAPLLGQERLPTRPIPGTSEPLPVVGLGSSKPVLEIPTEGTEPLAAVIRTLLSSGGRVVDTSPRTAAIDAEFGRVLAAPDVRDRVFLSTKINTDGAEAGVAQMREMQRLWGRRTMDLVQVESMRDLEAHWPNVRAWKESGEARYVGVTVSVDAQHDAYEAFVRREPMDFMHINYSVVETSSEERLLPLARDLGRAVLINRPFMNGTYFRRLADRPLPAWTEDFDCESWAQFSLKFVLAHPAVTCVLTETTSTEHMAENVRAAFGRLPDEATRRRMRALMQEI